MTFNYGTEKSSRINYAMVAFRPRRVAKDGSSSKSFMSKLEPMVFGSQDEDAWDIRKGPYDVSMMNGNLNSWRLERMKISVLGDWNIGREFYTRNI